jgi:transcriptional regulator with XRE-family HTH domain
MIKNSRIMQHLQPNATLQGGKYRIERVLGQGGKNVTTVSKWCTNTSQPDLQTLDRIAELLECDTRVLITSKIATEKSLNYE